MGAYFFFLDSSLFIAILYQGLPKTKEELLIYTLRQAQGRRGESLYSRDKTTKIAIYLFLGYPS